MFYFDIWEGYVPEWIPLWGGSYTALWPIFNVADASIFIGVALILIFQNRFFPEPKPKKVNPPQEAEEVL
jgi:signal peptidase II